MRLAFVDKGINSEVKSAYQPVISKNFNDSHFKMTLPVIKEFADRIEASFKFIYANKGEKVDSVLEMCIITDKFGKMHSSRMDYELLTHDRSKNVTISIPEDDKKIFISGSTIEFIFLCSNHKRITTSYKINYLTPEEFRQRIENNEFLEYEEVYKDRYYGTLKAQVEKQLEAGQNVVFDVDVVGGCNIKKFYGDRALSVFIQPPSVEELRCQIGRAHV